MATMDDIIRRLLEEQYASSSEGTPIQQGLLGSTPASEETGGIEYSAGVNANTPKTVEGANINQEAQAKYQGGLLGETPASTQQMTPVTNTAQEALDRINAKSQQNAQQMQNMQQEAIEQGIQSANQLQAKRDSEMQSTQSQAEQAHAKKLQEQQGLGGLLGSLLKFGLTGGTGVWGKKWK